MHKLSNAKSMMRTLRFTKLWLLMNSNPTIEECWVPVVSRCPSSLESSLHNHWATLRAGINGMLCRELPPICSQLIPLPTQTACQQQIYERIILLGYNDVQSVQSQHTFSMNTPSTSHGSKNKPCKKTAWSRYQTGDRGDTSFRNFG